MEGLQFGIESALPPTLVAGKGNALLVHGWCFHPEHRIRSLEIGLGGESRPALAHSMPRPDLASGNGETRAAWSGFWGLVEVGRVREPRKVELTLEAKLAGGESASAVASELELLPAMPVDWNLANPSVSYPEHGPLVAICMPTYEPKLDLLEAQISSLRAQTHQGWYCLICDDASRPETADAIEALIEGDDRFLLHRHPDRLGFYRNFERALSYVGPEADLIALCDQDDRWHPGKLEALISGFGDRHTLAYCDMRVVDPAGGEIAPSYWEAVGRRNERRDLATLMVSNTVTGAASLFRRSLLGSLLPFPEAPGPAFHDHWLALVALANGELRYVDRPLQDYVQHDANVVKGIELGWRERRDAVYANDVVSRAIFATIIARRCEPSMTRRKRRELAPFATGDTTLRGLTAVGGLRLDPRRRRTTGGLERKLFEGLLWRRVASARARRRRSAPGRGGPLPVRDRHGKVPGA